MDSNCDSFDIFCVVYVSFPYPTYRLQVLTRSRSNSLLKKYNFLSRLRLFLSLLFFIDNEILATSTIST